MAISYNDTLAELEKRLKADSANAVYDVNRDLGVDLQNQMASGADYNTVYNTAASRIGKANADPNLSQYAWDGITQAAMGYLLGKEGQAAEMPAQGQGTTSSLTTVSRSTGGANDHSDYLRELYNAQTNAEVAGLESAYNQNLAQLDAAKAQIPAVYDAARNRAAADAARSQRNFDQAAAASGLNSGTSAQARLANNVALQGNLNALHLSEAQEVAALEAQRQQLAAEYSKAVEQARANGNANLAAALYQEAIRVDEAIRAQEQYTQSLSQSSQSGQSDISLAKYLYEETGDIRYLLPYLSQEQAAIFTDDAALGAPEWGPGYSTTPYEGEMNMSEWERAKESVLIAARNGDSEVVDRLMNGVSTTANKAQWNELATSLQRYGYTGMPIYK